MSYPRWEMVAWSHMHHEEGVQEAHRWMDEGGRPTEKVKIKRFDGRSNSKLSEKTFDGETAWSRAVSYWNDVLHWSDNWYELPMHPPLYEDDDMNWTEGVTS